MAGVEPASEGV